MPASRLIGPALLAAALTAGAAFSPACAADEPAAGGDRPAEPRRAEGDRPPGNRPPGDRPPGERPQRPPGDRPERPPGDRPAGERPEPGAMLERMKGDILALDLSDDQKKQVDEIFAKTKDELSAHRQQNEGKEPGERMEGARAILQSFREKVGAVLSDEQRQALRQRMERAREGVREGARDAGGMMAERMKNAMSSLELNDEQKQKLDALLADSQRKMQELNEQTRVKMRELMTDTRGKINEMLTPEQREKFKDVMPEGGPGRGNPEGGERRRPEPPADRL